MSFAKSVRGINTAYRIVFGETTAREVNLEASLYNLIREMDVHEQEILLLYGDALLKRRKL